MDCPICHGDLGVEAFDANVSADDEVKSDVFRLSCGHAFHTGCLCRALRSADSSCPLCRGPTPSAENPSVFLSMAADGSMNIRWGDDEEEEDAEESAALTNLVEARILVDSLEKVRKLPHIQHIRWELNQTRTRYRNTEARVMRARSSVLRRALQEFRASWQPVFDEDKKELKKALKRLRKAEEKALVDLQDAMAIAEPDAPPVDLVTVHRSYSPDAYNLREFVGNQGVFGPLKRLFWTRT